MTRRMLINALRAEEVRMAIVTDGILDTYEVAAAESGLTRGNIYRGLVANVHPALDAAFVDFGASKDGLLRVDDVVPSAYHKQPPSGERRPRVEKILERGKPVIVQVVRDGIGHKGALVTTNISLAGRYLVLMPYDEIRGVSRKADDEQVRQEIKERLADMNLPDGAGVIARTNALDQPKTVLNRDLNALLRLWKRVRSEASSGRGPKLVYSDQDLIVQALRDTLDSSISEVLVDDDRAYERVRDYMAAFMPRAKTKLVRYSERMPLFSKYELEDQIDRIYQRKVDLPSGGSIVIDPTEALTAIDINSGRATRGGSQEEAVTKVNLEAAVEVARQLRLRDIGGLVVVDFIDMRSRKHQRDVEKAVRDAMKDDKARFSVSRLSPNGLMEINRQRLKKALSLRSFRDCPTCSGSGTIASPDVVGLNLLRRVETRAVTGTLKAVRIELHPELADAIQNDRRHQIADLEREFNIRVDVIASPSLHRSEEHVEWTKRDPREAPDRAVATEPPALTLADLGEEQRRDGRREPDAGDGGSGRKSRRRGGRRRKKGAEENGGDGDGGAAVQANDADDAGSPPPDPTDEETGSQRGRGAKRRRPSAQQAGDAERQDVPSDDRGPEDDGGPNDDDGAGDGDSGDGGSSSKRRRRRRGGRRRRRKPSSGGSAES